jgi:SAM-dependent methyltransferase
MAQIKGQAGVNLSQELANYLDANQGNLTSEQITTIINQYLSGGDKLGATGGSLSNGIYKRFGEFDQVNGKIEVVTTGLWSGDTGSMSTFFTSSTQTAASKNYYVNVYDKNPSSDTSAAVQYAVAYGHKYASGSVDLTTSDSSTLASKATYAQYKSILLDAGKDKFTFYSSSAAGTHDSDDIYVINVARARYKEKMDAGNWSLVLSGSTGTHTFIDDSGKKFSDTVGKSGRVFNVASGSLNLGTENEATVSTLNDSNGRGFGSFYPDQGLVVLNPTAIHQLIGTSIDSGSNLGASLYLDTAYEGQNHYLLQNAIENGIDFVLGIDLSADNIENGKNGAQKRYRSQITKFKQGQLRSIITTLPEIHFMVGDLSRNIRNLNAFRTDAGKQDVYVPMMESLLKNKKYNINDDKFNLISIQFAIHYMFDNREAFDGLLDNIEENLALGGLFIGTCFDGLTVWNKLKNMNKGEHIDASNDEGSLIWKIKKDYINRAKNAVETAAGGDADSDSWDADMVEYLPDDEDSLGHSIYVYISSIDALFQEYLVNMNYLIRELAKRNIRLLTSDDRRTFHTDTDEPTSFEDYYKRYEQMFSGNLSDNEKEWSFLNRTFVFRKYADPEDDIWTTLKRRIMDDRVVRANVLNGGDRQRRNYIMENYLNDDTLDDDTKQRILTYILVKITQEKVVLEGTLHSGDGDSDASGVDDLSDHDPYKVKGRTMSAVSASASASASTGDGLLSQTVVGDDSLQALKQLRECFKLLAEIFDIYDKFLKRNKHDNRIVDWAYLQSNFAEDKIEECLKILRTASKQMKLYDLYHIDILNIHIYTTMLDDYKRRKNDVALQVIDATERKSNGYIIDYYTYIRANTIMQQCIVDYVARVVNKHDLDLNPLHMAIFTEEHTIFRIPTLHTNIEAELDTHITGTIELFKHIKDDEIDYNQTVFAKLIQMYGRDGLIRFMKTIIKITKNSVKGKYPEESDIIPLPQVYMQLYKYLAERFLKNYSTTDIGKILVGGSMSNKSTINFDKMFTDLQSFDLYSNASTHNLGESEFEFMKHTHKDYTAFKQSGGNMNIRELLFITNMEKAGHCEKYAKGHEHPVCKQYVSDISEFKDYLRSRLKST